jgi:hypothetical protein
MTLHLRPCIVFYKANTTNGSASAVFLFPVYYSRISIGVPGE